MNLFHRAKWTAAAALLASMIQPALAKNYQVKMLNKGAEGAMVFEPALVKLAPGDSVTFVPTDKAHNAQSLPNMIPTGAAAFQGKINQQFTVVFSTPGVYVYKCLPHYFMGMVGVVQVGKPANLTDVIAGIAKTPPNAKARLAKLIARVK